jgi:hypothetical protein
MLGSPPCNLVVGWWVERDYSGHNYNGETGISKMFYNHVTNRCLCEFLKESESVQDVRSGCLKIGH